MFSQPSAFTLFFFWSLVQVSSWQTVSLPNRHKPKPGEGEQTVLASHGHVESENEKCVPGGPGINKFLSVDRSLAFNGPLIL